MNHLKIGFPCIFTHSFFCQVVLVLSYVVSELPTVLSSQVSGTLSSIFISSVSTPFRPFAFSPPLLALSTHTLLASNLTLDDGLGLPDLSRYHQRQSASSHKPRLDDLEKACLLPAQNILHYLGTTSEIPSFVSNSFRNQVTSYLWLSATFRKCSVDGAYTVASRPAKVWES